MQYGLRLQRMIKAARGTTDILPSEARLWQRVEKTIRTVFETYAFSEIRTPAFELTELFVRSVGSETDIVSKEMYTFVDKDETTSLSLRPEGTAPVVRAYIENRMSTESRMLKLYYIGPMFRRERPQKGRMRQFHQAGVEVLSSTDEPAIEAEVIEMLWVLFDRLGIEGLDLQVNSIGCPECRPAFVERLRAEIDARSEKLCGDCRRRGETNPLRVFDCKIPSCQPVIAELPKMSDHLCAACGHHFAKFRGYLDDRRIPYRVEQRLVRGLDYYTRTTFEIKSAALGAQDTIVAGGRYDGLAEDLGGPPTKGFGFGLGLERLVLAMADEPTGNRAGPDYFLATIGEPAFRYAMHLARKMRDRGWSVYLDFDGRSLKSQMRLADKIEAAHVVILGDDEVQTKTLTVRNMATHEQIQSTEDALVGASKTKLDTH